MNFKPCVGNDGSFRGTISRHEWQGDDANDGADVDDQPAFREKLQSQLGSVHHSDDIDLYQIWMKNNVFQ